MCQEIKNIQKLIHVITNLDKVNKFQQNFATFSDQPHLEGHILRGLYLNAKLRLHLYTIRQWQRKKPLIKITKIKSHEFDEQN